MFKVDNRKNTRTSCEKCSKLTIKTPIEHVIAGWDLVEFILKKNSFI